MQKGYLIQVESVPLKAHIYCCLRLSENGHLMKGVFYKSKKQKVILCLYPILFTLFVFIKFDLLLLTNAYAVKIKDYFNLPNRYTLYTYQALQFTLLLQK